MSAADPPVHLLLVDDNEADARWLEGELRAAGPGALWARLAHTRTLLAALDLVRAGGVDAVLLDLSLPDAQGVEAVVRLRAAAPRLPVVVLTAVDDQRTALGAMKEGAQDYLVKTQVSGALVARAVRYAIERKRAEEFQRREAAAAQTAQLREQFVAVLGHDLRNPLSSIAISAGLLLKKADMSERNLNTVARIARSADRMNRMIRDLLDFTRTRLGGGYTLSFAAGSLRDIWRHVVEELETVHSDRSLSFAADQSVWGNWDADRMAQLATNLICNGLQYSPPETPVRVELREEGGEAVVDVTSHGAPIAPELVPSLFEPFSRVQADPAGGSSPGLGLGLYIAHQIALAHGGRIDVCSSPGAQATTFSVRIPRQQAATSLSVPAPTAGG